MLSHYLKSKIHRAVLTDSNLNYEGSITLDPVLIEAASLSPYEKVLVVDINNGSRFETYVIEGKPHSGEICINGAAARLVAVGDLVIVMSFCLLTPEEQKMHRPLIVAVDDQNKILATSGKKE
jgi:aspartate 1-decarboxylase